MKKGLTYAALAAMSLTAVAVAPTPSASAATNQADGLYNFENGKYISVPEFVKLNVSQKIEWIIGEKVALVLGGKAIEASAIVTSSDEELEKGYSTIEEYQTKNKVDFNDFSSNLDVISVSAINSKSVEVTFAALTDKVTEATIVVKDNNNKVVEVVAQDLAKGATSASFDFVKAVDKFEGVWTVAGVTVDFDELAKLKAVYTAADQVKLLSALNELGLENVKEENIEAYQDALDTLKDTVSEEEFTKVQAQSVVDKGNDTSVDADAAAAAVKAVVEAKTQVALLKALQNEAFVRVNADWIADYKTAIDGTTPATSKDEVKEIQVLVDGVNNTALSSVTTTGIDKADLTEAKDLVTKYATPDAKGQQTTATKNTLKAIDTQLALVDVLSATTPTAFKAKLTALATLVNNTSTIDIKNYVDANGKAYIAELEAQATTAKDTVSEVEATLFGAITGVNDVEAGKLVKAVDDAASASPVDADKLLKALNDLGLKQVAESNKAVYAAEADFGSVTTKTSVQTAVDKANVTAVTSATDPDELLTALKVLELKNVVDANKDAYLADVTGGSATITASATTIDAALKVINTAEVEKAEVKAINEAKTATEVKSALDALAIASYVDVASADRLYIAEKVLKARTALDPDPANQKFTNLAAVEGALDTASTGIIAKYDGALSGINGIVSDSKISVVATALKESGHSAFNADEASISSAESVLAEKFFNSLEFKDDKSLKAPFKSLAAVNAAIDAVK